MIKKNFICTPKYCIADLAVVGANIQKHWLEKNEIVCFKCINRVFSYFLAYICPQRSKQNSMLYFFHF